MVFESKWEWFPQLSVSQHEFEPKVDDFLLPASLKSNQLHHGNHGADFLTPVSINEVVIKLKSETKELNRGAEFLTPTSFFWPFSSSPEVPKEPEMSDMEGPEVPKEPEMPEIKMPEKPKIVIKFKPELIGEQELKTEDDLATANRQCEKDFGQSEEIEHPCKLAVSDRYLGSVKDAGGGVACFPAASWVNTLHRGEVRLADLLIGDMVETCAADPTVACDDVGKGQTSWTRMMAWLHDDSRPAVPYLHITHTSGEIYVSAAHLVRVQHGSSFQEAQPKWMPAQDIVPGHILLRSQGKYCIVTEVQLDQRQGMYAPLTESGTLLVDGILCSCYAPPPVCAVPHVVCHAAMAPLFAFYRAQRAVELWDVDENGKPLLTIKAFHPWSYETFVHPYASVLLRLVQAVASVSSKLSFLDEGMVASDERSLTHE